MSNNNTAEEQAGLKPNLFTITNTEAPLVSENFELVMSQMNISNSIAFKKELEQQWKNAAQKQQLLSLLFCEVDFLHEYVEYYGVQGTSFMLISISLSLKNICDEHNCFLALNEQQGFTVLMRGATIREVQALSDKLCAAVRQSKTEHKHAKVNDFITLSVGISSLYPSTKSILKEKAKNSLVKAKRAGGNRVNEMKPSSIVTSFDNKVRNKANNDKIEKPKETAPKRDSSLVAEEEIRVTPETMTTTYRGQVTEKNTQKNVTDAPKEVLNAPNKDDTLHSNKNISPKKAVRMYRGQIVTD